MLVCLSGCICMLISNTFLLMLFSASKKMIHLISDTAHKRLACKSDCLVVRLSVCMQMCVCVPANVFVCIFVSVCVWLCTDLCVHVIADLGMHTCAWASVCVFQRALALVILLVVWRIWLDPLAQLWEVLWRTEPWWSVSPTHWLGYEKCCVELTGSSSRGNTQYVPLHLVFSYTHGTTCHYMALYGSTQHYTALHGTTLHYTARHYTALHCTIWHYMALHCTIWDYTALRRTICHYTALYATTGHYMALLYMELYGTTVYGTTQHYMTLYGTICH